jgi:hypothetical protein
MFHVEHANIFAIQIAFGLNADPQAREFLPGFEQLYCDSQRLFVAI